MLMLIKWGILLVLITIVPFILGMVPVKYMNKSQKTPAFIYISGWFVSFAVFELVSIPFIVFKASFAALVVVYSIVIGIMLFLSVYFGRDVLKGIFDCYKNIKLPWWSIVFWGLVCLVILGQMVMAIFFETYNSDDAFYMPTALMSKTFDQMYLRDCYTGYLSFLDLRHALSPMPIYIAWMSKLCGIHPTVLAHSVLGAVWLLLIYLIYGQIGNRLFNKNKEYRPLFLLLISIWFAFGNVSLYTTETFVMTRTWQGKAMMAGAVIPAMLLGLIYMTDKKVSIGMWIYMIIVTTSSVIMTSVSFMLVPTMVCTAAIFVGLQRKSFKRFVQIALCSVPCLLFGACYLLLK